MCSVNLNNCFNYTLLNTLHSIELFIKDSSRLNRIDCFKVVALPLNIHHHGKCSLCMTSFFCCHFCRTCYCKISSCPESYIVRKRSSCASHKIKYTLKTCKLHIVSVFFCILIYFCDCRCITCKKSFYHKLKKSVFCRKLCISAKSYFSYFIYGISSFCIFTGKPHFYMTFSKPFE